MEWLGPQSETAQFFYEHYPEFYEPPANLSDRYMDVLGPTSATAQYFLDKYPEWYKE